MIKGLILLIGIPNNKYHPNTKNYLRCLLIGGRLVLGGKDYTRNIPEIIFSSMIIPFWNTHRILLFQLRTGALSAWRCREKL